MTTRRASGRAAPSSPSCPLPSLANAASFPRCYGTEFTSGVVDQWAYQNQVALHFIERGKPTQNAFIESFNGKFRDECLNQNWFVDLRHAREVTEAWRVDYNTVRPHSSLRYRTPEEFAASAAARPASPPPRRSFLWPQRAPVRMCRNPGVLTYDWTKNGWQVSSPKME